MKWEYFSINAEWMDDDDLDMLGEDGWELVAIVPRVNHPGEGYFYLKRPKDTDKEDGKQ